MSPGVQPAHKESSIARTVSCDKVKAPANARMRLFMLGRL